VPVVVVSGFPLMSVKVPLYRTMGGTIALAPVAGLCCAWVNDELSSVMQRTIPTRTWFIEASPFAISDCCAAHTRRPGSGARPYFRRIRALDHGSERESVSPVAAPQAECAKAIRKRQMWNANVDL
jgi:hypothetical protein